MDTIFVHGSACDIEAVIIELKNDQFWRECVPFFTEIEPTKLALVVCFDIMTSPRLFTMFHLVSPHKERDRFFREVLLHELFPRGLKSSKFGKARVTIDIMGASMPKFKNKVETLFAEYIREKVENCLIDNSATTTEIRYMANMYCATKKSDYEKSVIAGINLS